MGYRNVVVQNVDTEALLSKILHNKHYGKQSTINNIISISQACCNHAFGIQISLHLHICSPVTLCLVGVNVKVWYINSGVPYSAYL